MSGFEPLGGLAVSGGKWFIMGSQSEHRGHVASHYFAAALELKGIQLKSVEEINTPLFGFTAPNVQGNKKTFGDRTALVYEDLHQLFYMVLATVEVADVRAIYSGSMWAAGLFEGTARRMSAAKNAVKRPFKKSKAILSVEAYWDRMYAADIIVLPALKDIRKKHKNLAPNSKLPLWTEYKTNGNIAAATNYKERSQICSKIMRQMGKLEGSARKANPQYFTQLKKNRAKAATIYGLTPKDRAYLKLVGKVVKVQNKANERGDLVENDLEEDDTSVFDSLLAYLQDMKDDRKKKKLKDLQADIETYLHRRQRKQRP